MITSPFQKIFILLLTLISFNSFAQISPSDTLKYFLVEQMPTYSGDLNEVVKNVQKEVGHSFDDFLSNKVVLDVLVKSDNSVVVSTRQNKRELEGLRSSLQNQLNNILIWHSGKHDRHSVNVLIPALVSLYNDKIVINLLAKHVKGSMLSLHVVAVNTNNPLPFVKVYSDYNNYSAYTDSSGEVQIFAMPDNTIDVSRIGYLPISFKPNGQSLNYKVPLTPAKYSLGEINLIRYSPKRFPVKLAMCSFTNFRPTSQDGLNALVTGDDLESHEANFNQGFDCFRNYLAKSFSLTKEAFANSYSDTVDVEFTTAIDGSIKNVILSKQLSFAMGQEISNLFIRMPKWRPAAENRVPLEQTFIIKLIFGPNNYWRKEYR